jgi:hypothetical protein
MASRPSLTGILKWSANAEWRTPFADLLDDHFAPACEVAGVSLDDLAVLIGVDDYMNVWSAAFADLLSRTDEEGRNMAQDYLRKHKLRETAAGRDYLAAHPGTVMSFYEVTRVEPGEAVWIVDLVRGGEAIDVAVRLAARVLSTRTGLQFAMGLLPFEAGDGAGLLALLARQSAPLAECADIFSAEWLDLRIQDSLETSELTTGALPLEVRWPLRIGTIDAARAAISQVDEAAQVGPDAWAWRRGALSMAGGEVVLTVSDEASAREAQDALDPVLAPWLRGPSVVAFDFGDHFQDE